MSKDFPYTINIPKVRGDRHWEQTQWCEQQFGKDSYTWTGSRFWFDRTEDAALFALRWA